MTTHWQLNGSANFALIVFHSGLEIMNVLSSVPCRVCCCCCSCGALKLCMHSKVREHAVLVATFYTSGLLPAHAKSILVGAEGLTISTKEIRQASWVEKPSKYQVDIWYKVQCFVLLLNQTKFSTTSYDVMCMLSGPLVE